MMENKDYSSTKDPSVMILLVSQERGKIIDHMPVTIPEDYFGKQFTLTWENVEYQTAFKGGFVLIEINEYTGKPEPIYSRAFLDPINRN